MDGMERREMGRALVLGWGKAGRMRAAERRVELLLFITSSSRSNRHGL